MDASLFDRITKSLAGAGPRRNAVKALAGVGLAAVTTRLGVNDASARCQKLGRRCGGNKKCCNKSGLVSCQDFPQGECQDPGKAAGLRCCGQEGAHCNPKFGSPGSPSPTTYGNCSCCAPLFCGKQTDGKFRCQTEDT
jgi:hypothetical protein